MRTPAVVIVVTLGLLLVFGSASLASAQEKPVGSPYYPSRVGSKWVYESPSGKTVTRVTAHEKIGGADCARVEAAGPRDRRTVEYVRAADDGLYRHAADGQMINPPVRFLKLPPTPGDTWTVDSKTLGVELKGTYEIDEEEIEVPAGRFKAIVVRSDDFSVSEQKVPHTYWFAEGVGMVRQVVEFGGTRLTLELESFELPPRGPESERPVKAPRPLRSEW